MGMPVALIASTMEESMTKKLIVVLGACAFTVAASGAGTSETIYSRPIRIGVQAGMAFSDVDTPRDLNPSNRTGLAVGLNLEASLSPIFAIQPEIQYVQRGFSVVNASNVKVSAKYDSIEVPVLAKFTIGSEITPHLVAGPVVIFNVNKSVQFDTPGATGALGFNPRTVDFAVAAGAGMDVGPFFASARFLLGIVDINESSAQYRSRGIQLLAGLRL